MVDNFIVGVDLDGVCADYVTGFRRCVAKELSIDPLSLPPITQWGYDQWGLSFDDYKELHRKAVQEYHLFRDLPLLENCEKVLWRLSDAGIWIRLITHRLYTNWTHQVAAKDTVDWLDKNNIPYRDICFMGAKSEVQADLYIEDAPHNVDALREAGNQVIVFDQPYNQDLSGLRAKNWLEAEEIILAKAAEHNPVQTKLPGLDVASTRLQ